MNESEQAQAAAERKLLNDTIDAVMQDERTDKVMNKSEQAQAIADIKEKIERYGRDSNLLILAMPQAILLTEIVDSQAQKIADQLVEIQKLTEERDKARRITEQYRGHDESDVLPWEKQ